MQDGTGRFSHGRRVASWAVTMALIAFVAAMLVVGCTPESDDVDTSTSATEVPTNVLPEDGSPIVYEFYTDT